MKNTTTLTALFCAISTFLMAQNRPIEFGISINPNYSFRYLYSDDEVLKATINQLYSGKFSYSIGGFGEKELSKKSHLRVGINAMNTGFQIVKRDLQNGGFQNGGTWQPFPVDPTQPTGIDFVYNYINLELPIDYQYFMNKKRTIFIYFGISPIINIYNYQTTKIYFSSNETKITNAEIKDEPINRMSLALQIGVGYAFKLNQKLTLDIQPRCQYFVTPLSNSTAKTGILPYNLGLQIGLKF